MTDNLDIRDELARLRGDTESSDGVWYSKEGVCYLEGSTPRHPIPDTFDAYITIIERDGWEWQRQVVGEWAGKGGSGYIQIRKTSNHYQWSMVKETGDLKRDFATAALAAEKARKGVR